jgi:PAS domain S-box-containing protein
MSQQEQGRAEDEACKDPESARRLLQELRTQKAILEKQNEELRGAKEELALTRAHYFDLYDSAPFGFFTIGEMGTVLEANVAAAEMLGLGQDELRELSAYRFIHGDDQATFARSQRLAFMTGVAQACEVRMLRRNGEEFWGHLTLTPSKAADSGQLCRVVINDVSEQKKSDVERRERDSWLRTLSKAIEQSPVTIVITDRKGDVEYANPTFERTSGHPVQSVIGKNPRILKGGDMAPEVYSGMWKTLLSGEDWTGIFHNRKKTGELYWESAIISPVKDENGTITHFLALKTDITEMRRLQEELFLSREEAIRANRAKSEFLSQMSHELRTPMNAILGFGQLLEADRSLGPAHLDSVMEITKAGRHLLDLINEVLDLSRIESGNIEYSLEALEFTELAQECRNLVQPLAEKSSIALELELPASSPVLGDRMRLKQVLVNLLSNAIKYNRPGGRVLVGMSSEGGMTRLSVTDNGAGIPEGRMRELFLPFNRLGAENTEIEGTGIGLTISKKLMETMGGRIGVRSELGVGSIFWIEIPVFFPASKAETADTETQEAGHGGGNAGTYVALHIEGKQSNQKLMRQILEKRRGIQLLTAPDAVIGLELAAIHKPDLILLDLSLPEMDGYDMPSSLHASEWGRDIPVIAVTALAMPADIERGLAAGFYDYITKPIDLARFLATVDACLAGKTR